MADYPTSVKTFTTKNPGDTVASAHVNDLQGEVTAIEGGLLNGVAHDVKPTSDGVRSLGTSALYWLNAFIRAVQVRTLAIIDNAGAGAQKLTISLTNTLTADRTLGLNTGDANRTLTLTANASLGGTNTGDVALAGTPDYITISGQTITRAQVDLAADVTGNLPVGNLNSGTGADANKFWRGDGVWAAPPGGSSGITDLTGDVTATGPGSAVATIANDAVTYAKMQDVSATDRLLGRATAGAGVVEEITCTAAARNLLDDANAGDMRSTLGLGTLATQNGTFSGTSSGTNTGDQTITLTGDVTGSGTGTFAVTIANDAVETAMIQDNAVTYAKMQNISAQHRLLGRVDGAGAGDPQEIPLDDNFQFGVGDILDTVGVSDVASNVTDFDITIENGRITAFQKNNV